MSQERNSKETKNESTLNFSESIFGKETEKPKQTLFGQVKGSLFGSGPSLPSLFGNGGSKPFALGTMPNLFQNSDLSKNIKSAENGDGEDGDGDSA